MYGGKKHCVICCIGMIFDYLSLAMRQVLLIFPDNTAIAEFILAQDIFNAEVNSREQSLTGELSEEQIAIATTEYNAILVNPNQSPDSNPFPSLWY